MTIGVAETFASPCRLILPFTSSLLRIPHRCMKERTRYKLTTGAEITTLLNTKSFLMSHKLHATQPKRKVKKSPVFLFALFSTLLEVSDIRRRPVPPLNVPAGTPHEFRKTASKDDMISRFNLTTAFAFNLPRPVLELFR